MLFHGSKVSEILRSLIPKNPEDLSVLRALLQCAQILHKGGNADLSLGNIQYRRSSDPQANSLDFDIPAILDRIPEDSKQYFYGLVEALDIYQSIYGKALPIQSLDMSDKSVYALKQIRDICMHEGLRSVY